MQCKNVLFSSALLQKRNITSEFPYHSHAKHRRNQKDAIPKPFPYHFKGGCFFHNIKLWVSLTPIPECVVVVAGFDLFRPPRAGGTRIVVIIVIVDPSPYFL